MARKYQFNYNFIKYFCVSKSGEMLSVFKVMFHNFVVTEVAEVLML